MYDEKTVAELVNNLLDKINYSSRTFRKKRS